MLSDWKTIDFSSLTITAENALQVTEVNGGSVSRSSVNDACHIYMVLAPSSMYNGWQIGYVGNDLNGLLDIQINTSTGDFKVVYPTTK